MFDSAAFAATLKAADALRDKDEIQTGTLARIKPQLASEWPAHLHPAVRNVLIQAGIPCPYQHQADAIRKALAGTDVVLESPTASGKTLAFTAPLLHQLVSDNGAHALLIYPTKALAFDQWEQLQPLCHPLSLEAWPYDGDTGYEDKKSLRTDPPQILLTNPEYLNGSFLGWREQWEHFLCGLRSVVIDEMHEYRGFFGSNMALLLRRFFLHLDRLGVSPHVFLSTATCANPAEHAQHLTGREVEAISARNVLRPQRHFLFVKPTIPDYHYRDLLRLRIEQAALALLVEGLQTLVFCPTKRFLEEAFRNCQQKAADLGLDPAQISAFHADLKNAARQDIQQQIKAGTIRVLFATNALELGLDIGGLDGVILAGFPPSIMSAWQQIGRAGRGWDKDAFVLCYAMNDPSDHFFVGNLDAFLHKPFDELVLDPTNEALIEHHLAPLAAETGGTVVPPDEAVLGRAFYEAAQKSGGTVAKNFRPHHRLKMRGGLGQSFHLQRGNEEVGQISALRRFREAYIGAIFPFFGQKYRVHAHEEHAVILTETEPHWRTEARFSTVLAPKDIFEGVAYGQVEVYYGSQTLTTHFTGYELVDDQTGEVISEGGTADSLFLNDLHAFWITVPPRPDTAAGIGALEHLLRVGAMFVIPTDRFDTSTYSKTRGGPTAVYYENHRGGIGVAKKLFEVWRSALEKGMAIAEQCACRSGCPNCIEPAKSYNISNAAIDKGRGIALARELLRMAQNGPDRQFRNGRMVAM